MKKLRQAEKNKLSYSTGVKKGRGRKKWYVDEDLEVVEDSSSDVEIPVLSSAISVDDENVTGQDVFSFRTSKKSGQMVLKASESGTSICESTIDTCGARKLNKASSKMVKKESLSLRRESKTAKRHCKPQTTTPYRLRKRHTVDESSDEDSVGETSEESAGETSEEESSSANEQKDTQSGRKKNDLTTNAEEYFDIHAAGVVTSDRTLSRLNLPQMDIQELRGMLQQVSEPHAKQQKRLWDKHCVLFRRWMFNMCNGFNILLFGLGSKHSLLEHFRKEYLCDFSHLVVNGYFPSLTVKQILNGITEDVLEKSGSFRSPLDQVEFIKTQFETEDQHDFYLVIHNIDGAMLRSEKTQNILSLLAQVRGIHLIASVDHINAPLIWDQIKCSRFRWLWQDVTTYSQYLSETSYENSLLAQQSGALALRSLTHVMQSLTPNARKIFQLLARYHLENASDAAYLGMSFQDLYLRCRESFLVNSDQTLRAQLVEFRDHKLIRAKKNYDGVEYLIIPLETSALREFLEQEDGS
ncbi:origin recognition complex subunit 2-like [Pomacea canaliculata]|uniref:origin recognition complex subunit 2-like n=1 Tax=Pomacea canaliculata TaxID=400727 RepID=UPI000D73155E|nr:origin recognition complex subunit 2-like [Pomacea canaliculata]